MANRSSLDPFREQIILWHGNHTNRQISETLAQPPYNIQVSHTTVGRYIAKIEALSTRQNAPALAPYKDAPKANGAVNIFVVSRNLIEEKWGRQLAECETMYEQAKQNGDEVLAGAWMARWQEAVRLGVGKFVPKAMPQAVECRHAENMLTREELVRLIRGE
jgi:hypothetical protein